MVVVESKNRIMGVVIERPHVTKNNEIIWKDATMEFFPAQKCYINEYQEGALQFNLIALKHLYQALYEIYKKSSSPRCVQALFKVLVREYGIWGMYSYLKVIDKNINFINTLFMNAVDKYREKDVIVDLKEKIHSAVMDDSDVLK